MKTYLRARGAISERHEAELSLYAGRQAGYVRELRTPSLCLEVPTVLLCSDDCAGLCPVCGCRKPCSCRHETSGCPVDERLAILKQLLN